MAVTTPQLEEPIYKPQEMAAPPMATGMQAQPLPAQAGYVSKAGAGAYIANNVLQGWLKGREINAQRNLQKAQQQIAGSDYAYQTVAQHYNDLLRAGKAENDPEVLKAKTAAQAAWDAKLQVMGKYAGADQQQPKKKGVKAKAEGGFEKMFGQIQPQMIARASLNALQQAGPQGLGLTPQDR